MTEIETFETQRTHLTSIAYRMLGEMSAAEDVVQEAWLRWSRAETAEVRDTRAWLSAVTVRLALDALRKVRARRESYVGPWLPEPILPDDMRAFAADTPAAHAELASDLSLALLHVLERLSPEERAAFILHDAFDCDYPEIAAMLEKSEPTCRKLVSRARERVKPIVRATPFRRTPIATSSAVSRRRLWRRMQCAVALFAPEIVFYTDGGGRAPAALNPIYGPDKVCVRHGADVKIRSRRHPRIRPLEINGRPGLVLTVDGMEFIRRSASRRTVADHRDLSDAQPDKLTRIERALSRLSAPGSSASV